MQHCSILQDHGSRYHHKTAQDTAVIVTAEYTGHTSSHFPVIIHLSIFRARTEKLLRAGPRVSRCVWRLCAVWPPQWPGCGARRGAGCRYVDIATRADTWSVLLSIFNLAFNSLLSIKLYGFLNIYLCNM